MEHWSEAKIAQHFQDLKNKTLLSAAARKDIQDYIEALCRRHRARGNTSSTSTTNFNLS
jgi:hypothetical protein